MNEYEGEPVDCEKLLCGDVYRYLQALVPDRHPLLRKMEDEARGKFPIIGPVVGSFCYVVTRLMGARRVFELGSGFG
jgi:predicted O-methyltransferase YrrM